MHVRVLFHNRTIDSNLVKLLMQFLLYKERMKVTSFNSISFFYSNKQINELFRIIVTNVFNTCFVQVTFHNVRYISLKRSFKYFAKDHQRKRLIFFPAICDLHIHLHISGKKDISLSLL